MISIRDDKPHMKAKYSSTCELEMKYGRSLSDHSETSTTCTSPAARQCFGNPEKINQLVSPFSIYNSLTKHQQDTDITENDWETMELRIFDYLSENNLKPVDLKDELVN